MEEVLKVTIQVDLKMNVTRGGMTEKEVFDAVETIRQSVNKQMHSMDFMNLFAINTDAYIEDV